MPDSEQDKGIEEEQVEDLDETKAEAEGESEDDVEGHAFDAFQKWGSPSIGADKVSPLSKIQQPGGINFEKQ